MTLEGAPFDLATYRGRPVIVNFWGPSCGPCRDEFPQFLRKLGQHAADDLAIVGVLTGDPIEPARRFAAEYQASWPTVIDPDQAIKRTYRVVARPHSWFIDRNGILQSQQIGVATDDDFERKYARIAR
jgi:thiol-disulfide isomerase/thioredoxin